MEKLFTLDGEEMREFTKEEYAQRKLDEAVFSSWKSEQDSKVNAKADLLTKLGITADEAALLLS
jgi:hypothetical protein